MSTRTSQTTFSLGEGPAPPTPGKKMVWNRRKQVWVEVAEAPAPVEDEAPKGPVVVSSNAYANGSNQNSGNFLGDRPMTRVHAPPGGASTFSFGMGMDNEQSVPKTPAPPASAMAEALTQPATPESEQTVPSEAPMTTPTKSTAADKEGEEEEEEGEGEEEAVGQEVGADAGAPADTDLPAPPAPEGEAEMAVPPPAPTSGVSSNVFASGASQNSGNFITDRPMTRVRAPPGGVSTLTFG